jgi:hypothetical protein
MSNKKIEIDDFILPQQEIDIGIKINPKARIIDFANVQLNAMDANLKGAIDWHLDSAKSKLKKLKDLFS